ncbi:hypothetical protein DFJ74DRAFT_773830 [Hyaloraphidium curvatum]|nr:hypothetical protein DFJ74DRAFT_773830 [Hyaloraphidium curvatum]
MVPKITDSELRDGKTSGFLPGNASSYRGLVVLITGASSGIGEAIAHAYAAQGCTLILAARRADRLEEVARRCRSLHPDARASIVAADVATPAGRAALAGALPDHVHRAFLNAGVSMNTRFAELPEVTAREIFEINLFANMELARILLPIMERTHARETDPVRGPRLAYVGSALGRLPAPFNTAYCASKAALSSFFDCLRYETPVAIAGVLPGPVRTEMIGKLRGPGGKIVGMAVDDPAVVDRAGGSADGKLAAGVIMNPAEAARLAALAVERGVREVVFPPLDRATARIRYGNREGQEVWEGQRSVGDTMRRMYDVPVVGSAKI